MTYDWNAAKLGYRAIVLRNFQAAIGNCAFLFFVLFSPIESGLHPKNPSEIATAVKRFFSWCPPLNICDENYETYQADTMSEYLFRITF